MWKWTDYPRILEGEPFWIRKSNLPDPPSRLLHLVDADDVCLSAECLHKPEPKHDETEDDDEVPHRPVAMPWLQDAFSPLRNIPDPLNLKGCCVTKTLLVVLVSPRSQFHGESHSVCRTGPSKHEPMAI